MDSVYDLKNQRKLNDLLYVKGNFTSYEKDSLQTNSQKTVRRMILNPKTNELRIIKLIAKELILI